MIKKLLGLITLTLLLTSVVDAANPGDKAPNCSANQLDNDEMLHVKDRLNKVVFIDFWASWCPPCKKSFPALDSLYNELKDRGFEVIAVNLDEDKNDALAFLQANPVDFSVFYDGEGECPGAYQVKAMPSSYIIDKQGVIRAVHLGFDEEKLTQIRTTVLSLLNE